MRSSDNYRRSLRAHVRAAREYRQCHDPDWPRSGCNTFEIWIHPVACRIPRTVLKPCVLNASAGYADDYIADNVSRDRQIAECRQRNHLAS